MISHDSAVFQHSGQDGEQPSGNTGRVIGLGGLAGSGKDALAAALEKHATLPTLVTGMSDALREYVFIMDPIIDNRGSRYREVRRELMDEGLSHDEAYVTMKHDYPELRRFLQAMGTDVFRDRVSSDYWVENVKSYAQAWLEVNDYAANVVVTGVRFPNEMSALREFDNSVLLYVQRPVVEMSAQNSSHNSENSVTAEDFDEVVYNDSTLDALDDDARRLVQQLRM